MTGGERRAKGFQNEYTTKRALCATFCALLPEKDAGNDKNHADSLSFSDANAQIVMFHQHRRIMHSAEGLYYFNGEWSRWSATQVSETNQDVVPDGQRDVYYPVYPLTSRPRGRGGKNDVSGAGGVFAEFDGKDFLTQAEVDAVSGDVSDEKHSKNLAFIANYDNCMERALVHILDLPVQPSAIIFSGGGFHCYWYFHDPVIFASEEERERFEAFLDGWIAFVGGDPKAKDLARVLRVPSTVNSKSHYVDAFGKALDVEFVLFDSDRRYFYDGLSQNLPSGWDGAARTAKARREVTYLGGKPVPVWTSALPDCAAVRRYNRETKIVDVLEAAGYVRKRRDRWVAPQSTTGESSVSVSVQFNNAYHFSAKNAIGREGKATPADFLLMSERFSGDVDACMAYLTGRAQDEGSPGFDHLYAFVQFGDIEPFVRQRKMEMAEEAEAKAKAAEAIFADNPTDENEQMAIQARTLAELRAKQAFSEVYATEMTDRAVMTALLQKLEHAWTKYGVSSSRVSDVGLAAAANKSRNTVSESVKRLQGWYIHRESHGEKRAPEYRLARAMTDVPLIEHVWYSETALYQTCSKAGTIHNDTPWVRYYSHDAFTLVMTPRDDTPEERRKVTAIAESIRTGTNVQPEDGDDFRDIVITEAVELLTGQLPSDEWRLRLAAGYRFTQERRFAASLSSLGGRALMLLNCLHLSGGDATGSALCDLMRIKRNRLSELARKLIDLGIVSRPDRFSLSIVPDWEDAIAELVKSMPTYGSKALRTVQHIDASIAYQNHRMAQAFAEIEKAHDIEEIKKLAERINAIERTLKTRESQRADIEEWANEAPIPDIIRTRILRRYGAKSDQEQAKREYEQHKRVVRLHTKGQLEDRKSAERNIRTVMKQVELMRRDGLSDAEIRRTLGIAGHSEDVKMRAIWPHLRSITYNPSLVSGTTR